MQRTLFGNMTTKQAGLLGTRAVFQSQWGTVTCLPMSLDNTPSLPLATIFPTPRILSSYLGFSLLPICLTVASSVDTSLHPPPFIQTGESCLKRRGRKRMRPAGEKTLRCLICSITRTRIHDLNACIQIPAICIRTAPVYSVCV